MKFNFKNRKLIIFLAAAVILVFGIFYNYAKNHRIFFHAYDLSRYIYNKNTNEDIKSSRAELIQMLDTNTPKEVLAVLSEKISENKTIANSCHGIAHEIGHHSYEKYGFAKALSFEDDVCGAGYIHGIVEAHFGLLRENQLEKEVGQVCVENNSAACFHGVGHGLMFATESNVSKSLTFCDIYKKESQRSNCYDGVFMQAFDDEDTGVTKPKPSFKDSFEYCSTFQKPYNKNCYFYAPRYNMSSNTPESLSSKCKSIDNPSLQVTCSIGSGVAFMKYHITELGVAENYCSKFGDVNMQGHCLEGLIRYYNFHHSLPNKSDAMCKENGIQNKDKCYNAVKQIVPSANSFQ